MACPFDFMLIAYRFRHFKGGRGKKCKPNVLIGRRQFRLIDTRYDKIDSGKCK